MSEVETKNKLNAENGLYEQYDWFYQNIFHSIQTACNEFFSELFSLHLVSISKNVNILFQGDDYFVTKIRIDKNHDVFFRCSCDGIKIILDKVLGENKKFNLTNITELEAKIISSFNDYMYNSIIGFLLQPPPASQKRKNFDVIHLTFFIKDSQKDSGAKLIVSLPQVLLNPNFNKELGQVFDVSDFNSSKIDVNINVGTTKFPLKDVKNLEKEDIVIFENSDIHLMKLIYKDYKKDFRVNPNPGLITSIENDNGGDNMEDNSLSQTLWDNIQVEMGAEFEKVKITLGELKNIEQGLVVDIASVYDNKISLYVENKIIAKGELVIINDRYGVRIDEVFASQKNKPELQADLPKSEEAQIVQENLEHTEEKVPSEEEEEFDYSDFELDDQDI